MLKNRATGEVYLVICLTVVLEEETKDDSDEEGESDDIVDVEDEQEVDDVD